MWRSVPKYALSLVLLGASPAFMGACQSVGTGRYVGRGEFDTLTRRVDEVEARVGLPPWGGGLPVLVSGGAPAQTPAPMVTDLSPPPSASTLAALKPPPGQPAARALAAPGPVSGSGSTESAIYQEGQTLLKAGKYDQAAGVFSRLLAEYPGGRLAPNARYWLGECYYAQGRFSEAAGEFRRCAEDYPQTDKAADALLKLSFSYDRLGDGPRAMAALDRLLGQYPRSNAAGLVKSGRGHF